MLLGGFNARVSNALGLMVLLACLVKRHPAIYWYW